MQRLFFSGPKPRHIVSYCSQPLYNNIKLDEIKQVNNYINFSRPGKICCLLSIVKAFHWSLILDRLLFQAIY